MAEGFKPSEAELRAWLVKTCEERYPYRNGETYHENWRPTDDTCRPVSYGVLRALLAIMAARESERDEAADAISALTKQLEERDRVATEAVEFIGVMRDEMVIAGWPSGDRTVLLANVRALLSTAPSAEGSDV